ELKRVLDEMVAGARGRKPLDVESLPDALRGAGATGERLELVVGMTLAAAERRLIEGTLQHTGGHTRRAAALLGVGRGRPRSAPPGGGVSPPASRGVGGGGKRWRRRGEPARRPRR